MVDERLSLWGWETGTGARFAIIVDAWGRTGEVGGGKQNRGLGEGDVKGVCFVFFIFIFFLQFLLNPPHPHLIARSPSAAPEPKRYNIAVV